MTDIMKLADDYAQHKYVNGAEGRGPDAPEARTGYARAALQSAIEALQAENERLTLERDVNKRMRDMHFAEKSALQSRVDAMGKWEAVAYSVGNTLKWHEGKGITNAQLYAAPKALAPLTDEQIYNVFAATVEDAEPFAELVGDPIWAEVVEITRSIEAAHGIHAKGGQHEDA